MNPNSGFDIPRPKDIPTPAASELPLRPRPVVAEAQKKTFQIQSGSEVYVRRSSGELEGQWMAGSEDLQTGRITVTKVDVDGNTLIKNIDRRELNELNRPTTLKDLREHGQQSIDDLVHVLRRLQEGGLTDANGFVPSEDEVQIVIAAYKGERPLGDVSSVGYTKQVLEHLMRLRQIRGELGQIKIPIEQFKAEEDRSVPLPTRLDARGALPARKMPEQGEWVTVQRDDGEFEGNWVMMQPNYETGEVALLQIVDNLPWLVKTVSLEQLREWNS